MGSDVKSLSGGGGAGALDFEMVGVCRWGGGVENRTLS